MTGDTEAYDATTNTWRELTADPTARTGPCNGVIGQLYDVGGYINNAGAATTVNESFNLTTDKWTTTLAPMACRDHVRWFRGCKTGSSIAWQARRS